MKPVIAPIDQAGHAVQSDHALEMTSTRMSKQKPSSGAPSAPLEGELLAAIPSRLTHSKDPVRCAVVCKAWAGASKQARYESLKIQHGVPDRSETGDRAQVVWLQDLQKDGRHNVQQAALFANNSGDAVYQTIPSFLSQAGTWHLQKVLLHGPICLATAVAVLPTTLTALDLWPDTRILGPALSNFRRFKKLQALKLAIGRSEKELDNSAYDFVIDTDFPGLKLLAVHNTLRCRILTSCQMGTCFPHLQHMSLRIKADITGTILAETAIALGQLHSLELVLLDGDGDDVDLVVSEHSLIEELHITGPVSKPSVSLGLNKAGMGVCCSNISVFTAGNPCAIVHLPTSSNLTSLQDVP